MGVVAGFCNVDLMRLLINGFDNFQCSTGHTSTSAILDISLNIVSFCSDVCPRSYQTHTARLLIPNSCLAFSQDGT